jgi:alpha,alpha-trehalase
MVQKHRLTDIGLNRYKSDGVGMPFEVYNRIFWWCFGAILNKIQFACQRIRKAIWIGLLLTQNSMNTLFMIGSSRESVHDTTNRLINTCANLNWVDINSFLYMYMYIWKDIAYLIKELFSNAFQMDDLLYTWKRLKANLRKQSWTNYVGMKRQVCILSTIL